MEFSRCSARFAAALLLIAFIGSAVAADEATVIKRTLKNTHLNELALWDVGFDKTFEIFVTDTAGNITCFSAKTLEPLWTRHLSDDGLTAPVIGDFMQTGAPLLAAASSNGAVYFLWPGSGEVLTSLKTDLSFIKMPTIAVRAAGDELVLADEKGFVAGYQLSPATGLASETFRVNNTTQDSGVFSVIGAMTQPPSSADLNADGNPEIVVVSDTGYLQVISLSPQPGQPPARAYTRISQGGAVNTVGALGKLSAGGESWIGYGVGARLEFYKWNPAAQGRDAITQAIQAPAFGNSRGHLLLGQLNDDADPDLLSCAEGTIAARYLGKDFSGGLSLLDVGPLQLTAEAPPVSAASPLTLATNKKAALTIDQGGTGYLWEPASGAPARRFSGLPVPTMFAPAGDFTGTGKLSAVIWNSDTSNLSVATLPADVAPAAQAAPCLTIGANYSRNGQWGADWNAEYQRRTANAADALQKAKTASAQHKDDTSLTTDAISQIAGLNPADPLAANLTIDKPSRSNISLITTGGIVLIALIAAGLYFLKRRR